MPRDKILLINYDFPPGLSGVRRIAKFAKYLPEFGFDPIVLCARPDERMPLDLVALDEVKRCGYPVVRTPSLDPYQLWRALHFRRRRKPLEEQQNLIRQNANKSSSAPVRWMKSAGGAVTRFFLQPDDRIGWLPFALTNARRILEREPVRYILTSSYPNSTHLAGLYLKRHFRIKWIADFRDGWTQNPYFGQNMTPLHRTLNRRWERNVVQQADSLITVSEPIAAHLDALSTPNKVHVIPNGFDSDDYADLEPMEFDKFTIAYTGTLFMQRSPEYFFAAVRGLLDEYPGLADNFQVIFRTRFKPEHEALISEMGLENVITNWGFGTHRDALRLQISADALLALEGDAPNSEIMLTQKVFEYLAAGKPILAVAPPGALASLVRRARAGTVVPPDNILRIKERLFDLFNGQTDYRPDHDFIGRFTRRQQASDLADVLTSLR